MTYLLTVNAGILLTRNFNRSHTVPSQARVFTRPPILSFGRGINGKRKRQA
jgi:hypothetical protein